jgi:hypothetical protein
MKDLNLKGLIGMGLVLSFAFASAQQLSRAYVDSVGAVHVVAADGTDHSVEKENTQSGAEQIKIAEGSETVGWLVDYPNPDPDRSWETLAGTLIIWRAGDVRHHFQTEQVFYDWSFVNGGKSVAFHTGPLHGEQQSHCELHDTITGKLQATWDGDLQDKKNAPEWAHSLDR